MKIKFKSVKFRLILIFIVILSTLTLSNLWAIFNFKVLNNTVEKIFDSNYKSIAAAQQMESIIERQDSLQLSYLSTKDQKYIDAFIKAEKEFQNFLKQAKNNVTEKGEKDFVSELDTSYNSYINTFYKFLAKENLQTEYYFSEIFPKFEKIKSTCKNLLELNQNAMILKRKEADITTKKASFLMITLTIIMTFLGIIVIIHSTKKILYQFNIFIDKIKKISGKDYSQKIPLNMDKEFNKLGLAFNQMTKQLDIYKQMDIEKILNEKSKAEAIVESISDGIIVTDMNNNIILVNEAAEKIFNIKEQDVLDRQFLEGINNPKIFDSIQEVLKNKNLKSSLKQIEISLASNNKKMYCKVYVSSISKNNENIGVITLLQDITKSKEIDKMKTEFIATVSHEFKTPLTSIGMSVDLLSADKDINSNPMHKDLIRIIKEEKERMVYLIKDLLDLSKIETGKGQIKLENCKLKSILENSIEDLKNYCDEQEAEVTLENIDENLSVYADPSKISLVIKNLISNAVKYRKENVKPKILIDIIKKSNNVIVSVKDNGRGIPQDYLEKIFEKFIQVKVSNDGKIEGTGLGLSICKGIIKAHNGEIWVESTVDKGSTFYFSLKSFN
ncbi:ATP-binding protein [Fusobacterium sp.]|uniref:ATP-binding protein n=1 Tax=Fusobacterium sp. TaxID=68766 RepID=UPI001DECE38B|nr:ATP-binding protein [Fusobacterium sp.]MBS5791134.1 PAS domain S-box protein [Fusobacterium sp.]MDY3058898.1 ATP-binding protein [Fusobacterium sp.]MEE1474854.1 ATP-binding protein [Fusobacterium sp.]